MKVLIGRDDVPHRRLTVRFLWEPRDAWVGVFTNRTAGFRLVYVCLLPCLPLVFAWRLDG
jgi:hypothetical protein